MFFGRNVNLYVTRPPTSALEKFPKILMQISHGNIRYVKSLFTSVSINVLFKLLNLKYVLNSL